LVTQTDVRNTVAGRFHKRQFQTRKPQRANACGFLMVGRSAGVPPPIGRSGTAVRSGFVA
jgi:hypothetical protein